MQSTATSLTPLKLNRWSWGMLISRTLLFLLWQAVFALGFWLLGTNQPWQAAIPWWTFTAALTCLCVYLLLNWLLKKEGKRYGDFFRLAPESRGKDILTVLGIMLLAAPLIVLPNTWVAGWLFGDPLIAVDLFARPLPIWAVIVSFVVFPAAIALTELPLYFGYCMPRLQTQLKNKWLAVGLPVFWLAAQHITLPFIPDGRFMLWRLLMFLPLALVLGVAIHWRPRLLPYFIVIHFLMDLSTVALLLSVSM